MYNNTKDLIDRIISNKNEYDKLKFEYLNENDIDKINFKSYDNFFDTIINCDLNNYLTDDILVKVDRASMKNSLETRAPFLNKNIFIFSINYLRNYGAAFNIFEGNRIFLSLVSILSSLILIYFIFVKEKLNPLDRYGLSFILAGSLGNGIDRMIKGYVIDFINLNLFNFPIFNIADIAINIGCIILIFNYFKLKNKYD